MPSPITRTISPFFNFPSLQRLDNAGSGFYQCAIFKTQVFREVQCIVFKIDLRDDDILRNTSRLKLCIFPCLALDIISSVAISACETRGVMMGENPVSGFKGCDFFADLYNFAGRFVPKNQRSLLLYVPRHNVPGTYAARLRFEQCIPRTHHEVSEGLLFLYRYNCIILLLSYRINVLRHKSLYYRNS